MSHLLCCEGFAVYVYSVILRAAHLRHPGLITDSGTREKIMFFRHLLELIKQFFGFAWRQKQWWIIPVVLMLLLIALLIVSSQAVAPFIYTLF